MSLERDLARRRAKAAAKLTPERRREITKGVIAAARQTLGCTCQPDVEVRVDVDDFRRRQAHRFLDKLAKETGAAVLATDTPPDTWDYEEAVVVNVAHDDDCPALAKWADHGPMILRRDATANAL